PAGNQDADDHAPGDAAPAARATAVSAIAAAHVEALAHLAKPIFEIGSLRPLRLAGRLTPRPARAAAPWSLAATLLAAARLIIPRHQKFFPPYLRSAPSGGSLAELAAAPCAPICGPCSEGSSMNNRLALIRERIEQRLDAIPDPVTGKGLFTSGRISGLDVREDGKVSFTLEAPADVAEHYVAVRNRADAEVGKVDGVRKVTAVLTAHEAKPQNAGGIG